MREAKMVSQMEDAVMVSICVVNEAENELALLIQDIEKAPFLSKTVISQRLFEIKQSLDISYLVA